MSKSVLIAMSGGVDSSTTAYILKKEGYNIIGATLHLFNPIGLNVETTIQQSLAINDAKKIANDLGIKHYVIDDHKTFQEEIINNFITDYSNNKTPIPCAWCNKKIKFYNLIKLADELGIEYIATGHYAQNLKIDKEYELHRGFDPAKDQSYFLFNISQAQLSRSIFPLGRYTKKQTREIARNFGIVISEKPDSQGICFVQNNSYCDFLLKIKPELEKIGNIIDINTNKVIGQHNGAIFYTIGQRKNIGIGGQKEPLYVNKIDVKNNIIYVGLEDNLYSSEFIVNDVNFISTEFSILDQFECNVVNRGFKPEKLAKITKIDNKTMLVKLKEKDRAITPGQASVMYIGTKVIGGGFVDKIIK